MKSSEKENRNEMSLSDENEKPLANAGLELAESLAGLMNSTSKEIGEGKEKKEKTEAAPPWPCEAVKPVGKRAQNSLG